MLADATISPVQGRQGLPVSEAFSAAICVRDDHVWLQLSNAGPLLIEFARLLIQRRQPRSGRTAEHAGDQVERCVRLRAT